MYQKDFNYQLSWFPLWDEKGGTSTYSTYSDEHLRNEFIYSHIKSSIYLRIIRDQTDPQIITLTILKTINDIN